MAIAADIASAIIMVAAESRKMGSTTIHVFLPREKVLVWAPVDAQHLYDDVYRIIDCRGEDEEVEFGKGALVRCQMRRLSGDGGKMEDTLVAYEAVDSN